MCCAMRDCSSAPAFTHTIDRVVSLLRLNHPIGLNRFCPEVK